MSFGCSLADERATSYDAGCRALKSEFAVEDSCTSD